MSEYNLQDYIDELVSRIPTAKIVRVEEVTIGEWAPKENLCHDNVKMLCKNNSSYKHIYGWLYSNNSEFGFINFMFHSVAQNEQGELIDITPSSARRKYPFLSCNIPNYAYEELMDIHKEERQITVRLSNT
jgi:hypothetical protein